MPTRHARLLRNGSLVVVLVFVGTVVGVGIAAAESYVPISGAGSTWSQNAIEQWRKNVNQYGVARQLRGHRVLRRPQPVPQRHRRLRRDRDPVRA